MSSNQHATSHLHAGNLSYLEEIESKDTNINKATVSMSDQNKAVDSTLDVAMTRLILAYEQYGHINANTNHWPPRPADRRLSPEYYGLTHEHMSLPFTKDGITMPISSWLEELKRVYCGSIGLEFHHAYTEEEQQWLRSQLHTQVVDQQTIKRSLCDLIAAKELEKELNLNYVGQKRFSLEGCDSVIPLLNTLIEKACLDNMQEIVLGMAHRGRLNVMTNVFGMPYDHIKELFSGYHGNKPLGDVKYHLGYTAIRQFNNKEIYLVLACNPSHLEAIAPVVMGSVRSRQEKKSKEYAEVDTSTAMGIILHGDAAIVGQGVCAETFNMTKTRAYTVGGMIHIVINNQLGFTTEPPDYKSTLNCTDFIKATGTPVIHVNAYDVQAVLKSALIAHGYRRQFRKDIAINIIGHRQHGHNESDDPYMTNGRLYKHITTAPDYVEALSETLINEGLMSELTNQKIKSMILSTLRQGGSYIQRETRHSWQYDHWNRFRESHWNESTNTSVSNQMLDACLQDLQVKPKQFQLSKQLQKAIDNRDLMFSKNKHLDWGACEILAYATLLKDGYSIRICGQDTCRGTFAHRHAIYRDVNTGKTYTPLKQCAQYPRQFSCYDSTLSEYAALGFEYGYSETDGDTLVIWEAQFGDFANNAQVIIDQFVTSAWAKWRRMTGLVLLLPHGAEGQGPEHTSARLERFLQLAADENIQVCTPTSGGQLFHLLRRQIIRQYRRPLIIMSPKSLLRFDGASTRLSKLTEGQFDLIKDDNRLKTSDKQSKIKIVLICCGKIYYEILQALLEHNNDNRYALIRIEQLYPVPKKSLAEILAQYQCAKVIRWCQEEPKNQGAWYMIQTHLNRLKRDDQILEYAGREAMASPAEGDHNQYKRVQTTIIQTMLEEA